MWWGGKEVSDESWWGTHVQTCTHTPGKKSLLIMRTHYQILHSLFLWIIFFFLIKIKEIFPFFLIISLWRLFWLLTWIIHPMGFYDRPCSHCLCLNQQNKKKTWDQSAFTRMERWTVVVLVMKILLPFDVKGNWITPVL